VITVLVLIALTAIAAAYVAGRLWLGERQRGEELVRRLALEARLDGETLRTLQAMRQAVRQQVRRGRI